MEAEGPPVARSAAADDVAATTERVSAGATEDAAASSPEQPAATDRPAREVVASARPVETEVAAAASAARADRDVAALQTPATPVLPLPLAAAPAAPAAPAVADEPAAERAAVGVPTIPGQRMEVQGAARLREDRMVLEAPSSGVTVMGDSVLTVQQMPFAAAVAAFRENVRRARAGEFEWLVLSRDDLLRSDTPPLMVAGAGEPVIDAAAGAVPSRLLRVRQTVDNGAALELLVWRLPTVQRDAVGEPGAPPRMTQQRPRAETATTAPYDVLPLRSTWLAGGEHEVVVFVPALDALVTLRSAGDEDALRGLARRLVPLR
jgi:hypothetical protein